MSGLSVGAVFLDADHPPLDFDALLTDADASMYMDKKARKMARAWVHRSSAF